MINPGLTLISIKVDDWRRVTEFMVKIWSGPGGRLNPQGFFKRVPGVVPGDPEPYRGDIMLEMSGVFQMRDCVSSCKVT